MHSNWGIGENSPPQQCETADFAETRRSQLSLANSTRTIPVEMCHFGAEKWPEGPV